YVRDLLQRRRAQREGDVALAGCALSVSNRTIGFVGGGNMAEAMIRGLLRGSVFAAQDVIVSGPREERMRELRETYGIRATTNNREAAASNIVVLSVKPQILSRVIDQIADAIDPDALV